MANPETIRSPCPITKAPPRNIRGLYFRASVEKPVAVNIATTIPDVETELSKRFPSFESVLGTRSSIHECLVTCFDPTGKQHTYLLAYQEHPELAPNRALRKVFPDATFKGELVVMRSGVRSLVVGIKGKQDARMAEVAVRRFLIEVHARRARNRRVVPEVPHRLV